MRKLLVICMVFMVLLPNVLWAKLMDLKQYGKNYYLNTEIIQFVEQKKETCVLTVSSLLKSSIDWIKLENTDCNKFVQENNLDK